MNDSFHLQDLPLVQSERGLSSKHLSSLSQVKRSGIARASHSVLWGKERCLLDRREAEWAVGPRASSFDPLLSRTVNGMNLT